MKISRPLNPQLAIFIAFVLLTSVWITLCLPTVAQALRDADSAHQLAGAAQILHGLHPFIDFETTYGPLTFYTSALVQLVFGQRFIGEILLCMSAYMLGYGLLAVMMYRITGKASLTFLFGILALLAMPRLYKYYIMLGPVMTVWFAWQYIHQPKLRNIFWLALAALITGLFRADVGVYCVIAATLAVFLQPAPGVGTLKRLLILWGEIFLLALPWLAFLVFHGSLQHYFYDSVTGGANIAVGMSLSFPSFQLNRPFFAEGNQLFILSMFFCSLPFVGLLFLILKWRMHEIEQRKMLIVTLVLYALSLIQAFGRFEILHLSQTMPLAFLLGAWMTSKLIETLRPSSAFAFVLLVLLLLAGQHNWAKVNLTEFPENVGQFALSKGQMLSNANQTQHLTYASIMLYIRRCTNASQRFMGLPALTSFPYFTDRAFGGGQMGVLSGYFVTPSDQQRIVATMKKEDIPLILNVPGFAFDKRPERKLEVAAPVVANYLQENYHLIKKIVSFNLLLRNDLVVKQNGSELESYSCPMARP